VTFDEARFAAWLAVERTRRHDVPGFEHAMFFEWTRLGRPAAAAAEGVVVAPVVLAAPAPAPATQRPAPRRQSARRAAPAAAAPALTSLF